jgi:hypothetical protein
MKYTKIDLPDDFEKGQCVDCPFSFMATTGLSDDEYYDNYCVFFCRFDECPLEIESEIDNVDKFSVGEKVRVNPNLKLNFKYGDTVFNNERNNYLNKIIEITQAWFPIREGQHTHYVAEKLSWTEEMLIKSD